MEGIDTLQELFVARGQMPDALKTLQSTGDPAKSNLGHAASYIYAET
jgi:hypothetical protein